MYIFRIHCICIIFIKVLKIYYFLIKHQSTKGNGENKGFFRRIKDSGHTAQDVFLCL